MPTRRLSNNTELEFFYSCDYFVNNRDVHSESAVAELKATCFFLSWANGGPAFLSKAKGLIYQRKGVAIGAEGMAGCKC